MIDTTEEIKIEELLSAIVEGAQNNKAKDIVSLELRAIDNANTDYFVICHGQSDRQTQAIAESIEKTVFNKYGIRPYHREGYETKEWILLDYFDIVAHIFLGEKREFFAIEELWADAPSTNHESFD